MAVFSRYARVNEPDGSPMRVRAALSLINQVLDEKLSQLEGDVSADTRWCVEWFKQYGFDAGAVRDRGDAVQGDRYEYQRAGAGRGADIAGGEGETAVRSGDS